MASPQERLATYNDPQCHIAAQVSRHCVCFLLDNIQRYPEEACLPNTRLPIKTRHPGSYPEGSWNNVADVKAQLVYTDRSLARGPASLTL